MKKNILLLALFSSLLNATAMEVTVAPGELPKKVSVLFEQNESYFTIKGVANSSDLISLKNLPDNIKTLDLSGLTIKGDELIEGVYCGVSSWQDGELPAYMLMGTAVEEVIIPESTTIIGDGVFARTALKKFNGKNVEAVGTAAFYGCNSLESVDFSESKLTSIPERCFSDAVKLKTALFPASLNSVGVRSFYHSGLSSIYLPGVKEIGDYAFALCPSLAELTFATGCVLGEGVFFNDGSLDISNYYFVNSPALVASNTSLDGKELILHGPVIKEGAYSGTEVAGLKFADDVVRIEDHAFRNTHSLQNVNVLQLKGNIPWASEEAFSGVDTASVHLIVEKEYVDQWKEAPVWKNFIIDGVATGIEQIADSHNSIRIGRSGDIITVLADEPIKEVIIYSLSGIRLASVEGGDNFVEIRIPDEAEQVLIVKAIAEKETKVVKIYGKE